MTAQRHGPIAVAGWQSARRFGIALALVAAVGMTGCHLLDVDNPNDVNEEALDNPKAAAPQVDGVVAALARGIEATLSSYSTATDELTWIGSREGWQELDRGDVRDAFNEFADQEAFYVDQARWLANSVVHRIESFDSAGTLADRTLLAKANLYDAVTYDYIGNFYDDFVIASDRTTPGDPVGPANMGTMYDSAMAAVDRGLKVVGGSGTPLEGQLLAIRARAQFDKAIWTMLNPSGNTPTNPLVNSPGAAADAQAALGILQSDDRMQLELPTTDLLVGDNSIASNVNSRQEMKFGSRYASYNYTSDSLTVFLTDPIDAKPSPELTALVKEFVAGVSLSPITVTGSRDMLLIIAENALANNDTPTFTSTINQLRGLDNLTAWSGQISALDMLKYERMENLFLQGRRLSDMYRFGITAPEWVQNSDAVSCPGSFFPITITERQSNPKVTQQPACGQ